MKKLQVSMHNVQFLYGNKVRIAVASGLQQISHHHKQIERLFPFDFRLAVHGFGDNAATSQKMHNFRHRRRLLHVEQTLNG